MDFKNIFGMESAEVETPELSGETVPVEDVELLEDEADLVEQEAEIDHTEAGINSAEAEVAELDALEDTMEEEIENDIPMTALAAESLKLRMDRIKRVYGIKSTRGTGVFARENFTTSMTDNLTAYRVALEEVKEVKQGFFKGIWEAIKKFFNMIWKWITDAGSWAKGKVSKVDKTVADATKEVGPKLDPQVVRDAMGGVEGAQIKERVGKLADSYYLRDKSIEKCLNTNSDLIMNSFDVLKDMLNNFDNVQKQLTGNDGSTNVDIKVGSSTLSTGDGRTPLTSKDGIFLSGNVYYVGFEGANVKFETVQGKASGSVRDASVVEGVDYKFFSKSGHDVLNYLKDIDGLVKTITKKFDKDNNELGSGITKEGGQVLVSYGRTLSAGFGTLVRECRKQLDATDDFSTLAANIGKGKSMKARKDALKAKKEAEAKKEDKK